MMKRVVLINNADIENLSTRCIGAYLKRQGVKVTTIHSPGRKKRVFDLLSKESLDLLRHYCSECDLVGISLLTTHHLQRAKQISHFLRDRISAKIIWGGVPVICDPNYYLQYVDLVCLGEGEKVMQDLLSGKKFADIDGLGYKTGDGRCKLNPRRRLTDVNQLPLPHMAINDSYLLETGRMVPLREALGRLVRYSVLSVRGCPYSCSYCLNSRLKHIFSSKGAYIRYVDTDRVISELEWAKRHLPNLREIIFEDDDFFLRPRDELNALLQAYARSVDLPIFFIQSNIKHITEAKLRLLTDNHIHLQHLHIGLQSGSQRTNKEIFNRGFDRQHFLNTLKTLNKRGIRVVLHIISANPYETLADKHATLKLYHDIIRATRCGGHTQTPVQVYDHKLMFYPGSKLYRKAKDDGIIPEDYIQQVLLKRTTLRKYAEDHDPEALMARLFNAAAGKGLVARSAYGWLKLLRFKFIFYPAMHYMRFGYGGWP